MWRLTKVDRTIQSAPPCSNRSHLLPMDWTGINYSSPDWSCPYYTGLCWWSNRPLHTQLDIPKYQLLLDKYNKSIYYRGNSSRSRSLSQSRTKSEKRLACPRWISNWGCTPVSPLELQMAFALVNSGCLDRLSVLFDLSHSSFLQQD